MLISSQMDRAERNGELTKPGHCEMCEDEKPLVRHHRNYNKPLEIKWLCHKCHGTDHAAHKTKGSSDRHVIQFSETLWERLQKAAIKESAKKNKIICAAEYVRQIVSNTLKRKGF